jgi:hypothetical protein
MTDEREGKPSASNFDRYAACPGSWELSKHAPPQVEEEWTKDGTIVHDLLAGIDRPDATEEHKETAEKCKAIEDEARKTIGVPPIADEWRERRWWDPGMFSGKADLTVGWKDDNGFHLWIHDHKTGRADVDPAPTNHQLRALVAASADDEVEFYVSVGGPHQSKRLSIARYDKAAIQQAKEESAAIVERLTTHKDEFRTGDHCRYCPAKPICPTIQGLAVMAPQILSGASAVPTKETMAEVAQSLSNERLATLMEGYKVREWANEAIFAEMRRRLTAGEVIPGWILEPGEVRESIVDTPGLYGRMQTFVQPDEFCRAAKFSKESVKKLAREKLGLKGKALDAKVKELVDGLTLAKECKPSVVRVENQIEGKESQ